MSYAEQPELDLLDDGPKRTKMKFAKDTCLNSPLILDDYVAVRDRGTTGYGRQDTEIEIINDLFNQPDHLKIDCHEWLGEVLMALWNDEDFRVEGSLSTSPRTYIREAVRATTEEANAIAQMIKSTDPPYDVDDYSYEAMNVHVKRYLIFHRLFDLISKHKSALALHGDEARVPSPISKIPLDRVYVHALYSLDVTPWVRISYTENYTYFEFKKTALTRLGAVADHNIFLMIHDVFNSRFNTLLLTDIASVMNLAWYPSIPSLQEIYEVGDKILATMGNEGYKLLKMFEPVVVSSILYANRDADLITVEDFYNNINEAWEEAVEEKGGRHRNALGAWRRVLGGLNDAQRTQVHGVFRHWGHPLIDPIASCKKLARRSRTPFTAADSEMDWLEGVLRRELTLAYYNKHGKLPEIVKSTIREQSKLYDVMMNKRSYQSAAGRDSLDDWKEIRFEKTFSGGEDIDIMAVIQDRAHSLPRSKLIPFLDAKRPSYGPSHLRKVTTTFLGNNFGTPDQILAEADTWGDDLEKIKDELAIALVCKERELNPEARNFVLMTMSLKLWLGLSEELINQNIVKLFKAVTTSDSMLELIKKLYGVSKDLNGEAAKHVVHVLNSLDFEKWNNQFREMTTRALFAMFDELHGFRQVFGQTHQIWSNCVVYSTHQSSLPTAQEFIALCEGRITINERETAWTGHLGGFDGLRQKSWTVWNVIIESVLLRMHGLKGKILGQGDNQIVNVSVLIPQRVQTDAEKKLFANEQIHAFLRSLRAKFRSYNQELKLAETWSSSQLVIYGKQMINRGCFLPMTLKRGSRMADTENELYPTFEKAAATISASGTSGVGSDFCVGPSLVATRIRLLLAWDSDARYNVMTGGPQSFNTGATLNIDRPRSGKYFANGYDLIANDWQQSRLSTEMMTCFLFVGTSMGGYSVPLLLDLMQRGFPDPFSTNYLTLHALLAYKKTSYTKSVRDAFSSALHIKRNTTEDLGLLFEDPVAINLLRPVQSQNVEKHVCSDMLRGRHGMSQVKNEVVRSLIQAGIQQREPLIEALSSMSQVCPRISHEILDASPAGIVASTINRFAGQTTVVKAAMAAHNRIDVKTQKMKGEGSSYISLMTAISPAENIRLHCGEPVRVYAYDSAMCPSWNAGKARDFSWGREIHGVTVPHPLCYTRRFICKKDRCAKCDESVEPEASNEARVAARSYVLTLTGTTSINPGDFWSVAGKTTPYFGNVTRERVPQVRSYVVESRDRAIRNMLKNYRMIGWIFPKGSNMEKLLDKVVGTMTDLDPALLKTSLEHSSGDWRHRFGDQATTHGSMLNRSYTTATHYVLSTNPCELLAKGTKNRMVHFQSLLLLCSWFDESIGLHTNGAGVRYPRHYHIAKHIECIPEFKVENFDVADPKDLNLESCRNVPGLWVPKERITIEGRTEMIYQIKTISSMSKGDKFYAYYALVAKRHVDAMINSSVKTEDFEVGQHLGMSIGLISSANGLIVFFSVALEILTRHFLRNDLPYFISNSTTDWAKVYSDIARELRLKNGSFFRPLCELFLFPDVREEIIKDARFPMNFEYQGYSIKSTTEAARSILCKIFSNYYIVEFIEKIAKNALGEYRSAVVDQETDTGVGLTRYIIANLLLRGCNPSDLLVLGGLLYEMNHQQYPNKRAMSESLKNILLAFDNGTSRRANIIDIILALKEPSYLPSTIDSAIKLCNENVNVSLGGQRYPEHVIAGLDQCRETAKVLARGTTGESFGDVAYETKASRKVERTIIGMGKHRYKPVSISTTSQYKILSILRSIELLDVQRAICLADGSGGFTMIILELFKNARVFFHTMSTGDDLMPHSQGGALPPAFEARENLRSRLVSPRASWENPVDLLTTPALDIVPTEFSSGIDLVTCDLESEKCEDLATTIIMLNNLMAVCRVYGKRTTTMICKVYLENEDQIMLIMNCVLSTFENCQMLTTFYTSCWSREMFIVANGVNTELRTLKVALKEHDVLLYSEKNRLSKVEKLREDVRGSLRLLKEAEEEYSLTIAGPLGIEMWRSKALEIRSAYGIDKVSSLEQIIPKLFDYYLRHYETAEMYTDQTGKFNPRKMKKEKKTFMYVHFCYTFYSSVLMKGEIEGLMHHMLDNTRYTYFIYRTKGRRVAMGAARSVPGLWKLLERYEDRHEIVWKRELESPAKLQSKFKDYYRYTRIDEELPMIDLPHSHSFQLYPMTDTPRDRNLNSEIVSLLREK